MSNSVSKTIKTAFAVVAIASGAGSLYYHDKGHNHGYTNPHHETIDAVAEAGKATDAQKDILVQSAVDSVTAVKSSNKMGVPLAVGVLGFMGMGAYRRKKGYE